MHKKHVGYVRFHEQDNPADRRRLDPLLKTLETKGWTSVNLADPASTAIQPQLVIVRRADRLGRFIDRIESLGPEHSVIFDHTNDISGFLNPGIAKRVLWPLREVVGGENHRHNLLRLLRRSNLAIAGSEGQADVIRAIRPDLQVHAIVDHLLPDELRGCTATPVPVDGQLRLFWEGTGSSAIQLNMLRNILAELDRTTPIHLTVVADPVAPLAYRRSLNIRALVDGLPCKTDFLPWSRDTLISAAHTCHVGIAPIDTESPFNRRKPCNKVLMYWALGLGVVASDIPSYRAVIRNGENGFLATDATSWRSSLKLLGQDPGLRRQIADEGRTLAWSNFHIDAFCSHYMDLIARLGLS